MYRHFSIVKWVLAGLLLMITVAYLITLFFGGLFFNLDGSIVSSWFFFVLAIVFVLTLLYAIIVFIGWFLFTKPWNIVIILGGLLLTFVAIFIFIKLPKDALIYDLRPILQPIFSFLK